MTDTELKNKGFEILTEALGIVEAERFVSLLLREPFDYTEWQRDLFANQDVDTLSAAAMKWREKESG